jgi:outer membrane protein assembly factor BamB
MNPANGEYHWKERIGTKFYASPIWVGDRLYCVSRDGEVTVLAASEKHQVLAKFSLGEATDATPAVAGGSMYIRTQSHLMAIGGKK